MRERHTRTQVRYSSLVSQGSHSGLVHSMPTVVSALSLIFLFSSHSIAGPQNKTTNTLQLVHIGETAHLLINYLALFPLKSYSVSTVVPHYLLSLLDNYHPNQFLLSLIKYLHMLMYIIIIIAMIRFPHFLFCYRCYHSRRGKAKSHLTSGKKKYMERHLREISAV